MTIEEVIAELERLAQATPESDGFTVPQMAKTMGVPERRLRVLAKQLVAEGRAVPAMVTRRDDWGFTETVRGYRLLAPGGPRVA